MGLTPLRTLRLAVIAETPDGLGFVHAFSVNH
jgi:hypothetical protein